MLLRLHDRLRAEQDPDSGFAMIFTLLLIFIVAALSIAVAGIVYNQSRPTQYERKQVATVDAAYAGIQVALGQIRSASITSGTAITGQLTGLRCTGATAATFVSNGQTPVTTSGVTFTGTTNTTTGNAASAGNSAYVTDVAYYTTDPTGHTLAWLQANAMTCPLSAVPSYAYLQSHGIVQGQQNTSGDRTQHVTYQFTTTSAQANGGTISYGLNCWTAPAGAVAGSAVYFQPCLTNASPLYYTQSWYYRPDLTIQWIGNPTATTQLCLDFSSFSPSSKPTAPVTLQPCLAGGVAGDGFNVSTGVYGPGSTNALAYQEFVFFPTGMHDASLVSSPDRYSSTPGQGFGSSCVSSVTSGTTIGTGAAGESLVMNYGCNGGQVTVVTSPQVAPGDAAGATTGLPGPSGQFSNNLYNNCLQNNYVPNPSVLSLALGVCGQSANVGLIGKNSVWVYSGTTTTPGTISSTRPASDCNGSPSSCAYNTICLTTAAAGQAPSDATCTGAANQLWQLTGTVAGDYAHSYLIEDTVGNCLTGTPLGAASSYYLSSVLMTACPGAGVTVANLAQQWNAPPKTTSSGITGLGEDSGSANNVQSLP